jgi:hypothetical protein
MSVDPLGRFLLPLTERRSTMIREMLGIAEGILQDLHNDHGEVGEQIPDPAATFPDSPIKFPAKS